jgi:iron complex outermembrane receptor protein
MKHGFATWPKGIAPFFRLLKIGVWLLLPIFSKAQSDTTLQAADTLQATVRAFELHRKALLTVAVEQLPAAAAMRGTGTSLLTAFNSVAGVRMEERSPGSYRLNMRGSTLRSPFGVRNVKVYWNQIPLTDPGGNTYLNQLGANSMAAMEVVKGPAGSMYGAGTGGMVQFESLPATPTHEAGVEIMAGSYGLFNILGQASFGNQKSNQAISFAHNQADGYRQHTRMRRDQVAYTAQLSTSPAFQLQASALFANLYYQTPGALTQAEYDKDPSAARPAAGGLPSAQQAQAAIYQQNALASLSSTQQLGGRWSNTTALYLAWAQVKNPSIRNYEQRSEPHLGGRSYFAWQKQHSRGSITWITGAEYQAGFFTTRVSKNKNGQPDTLQTEDDINLQTGFAFTQLDAVWNNKWYATAGISLNRQQVAITRVNRYPVTQQQRTYSGQVAPRLVVLRKLGRSFSAGATVSRGFSPPTLAEVLPSTGIISTQLEAESGINYEAVVKYHRQALQAELGAYYFGLRNALALRRDASGADYYVNAGKTNQNGLEAKLSWQKALPAGSILRHIKLEGTYTFAHFTYEDYRRDTLRLAGNTLPGIPSHTCWAWAEVAGPAGLYLQASYLFNAFTYLNDVNTARAMPFHLLGLRAGIALPHGLHLYAGADNLLNQTYSLGNDLNDPRGRFFNAAPGRNWYAELRWSVVGKGKG